MPLGEHPVNIDLTLSQQNVQIPYSHWPNADSDFSLADASDSNLDTGSRQQHRIPGAAFRLKIKHICG